MKEEPLKAPSAVLNDKRLNAGAKLLWAVIWKLGKPNTKGVRTIDPSDPRVDEELNAQVNRHLGCVPVQDEHGTTYYLEIEEQ